MQQQNTREPEIKMLQVQEVFLDDISQLFHLFMPMEKDIIFTLFRSEMPLTINDIYLELLKNKVIQNWELVGNSLAFGKFKIEHSEPHQIDHRKIHDNRELGPLNGINHDFHFIVSFKEKTLMLKIRNKLSDEDWKNTRKIWLDNYLRTPYLSFSIKETLKILRKNHIDVISFPTVQNRLETLYNSGFVGQRRIEGKSKTDKLWFLNPLIRQKVNDKLDKAVKQ
jgi:hypothetical protein